MKPVVILSETASPEEVISRVPVGAYAFAWGRDKRNQLGIRLVEHKPTGPAFSCIYETGSEYKLRLFASSMVSRHPNERWVFES
jgi:hypothetical protein